jgi:hypothetical protein
MRHLARIAGVLLLFFTTSLAIAGAMAPFSGSSWLALTSLGLAGVALVVGTERLRRILGAASGTLCLAFFAARLVGAKAEFTHMIRMPDGSPSSRWAGRLLDEEDASLLGARALGALGRIPRDEADRLVPAMREAYAVMREGDDNDVISSPVLDTGLGRQGPSGFDMLAVEPHGPPTPGLGVVFLHGAAGSFALECWLVADAARAIGAVTVCPATDFSGNWLRGDGERILRASIEYLERRGIGRVYLVGLSNGAIGAGVLGPKFTSVVGLVLISGTSGSGDLPTLVVQGEHDTWMPPGLAHAFAARTHATYAGFDGGHFVLLVRRAETRDTIAKWLEQREHTSR